MINKNFSTFLNAVALLSALILTLGSFGCSISKRSEIPTTTEEVQPKKAQADKNFQNSDTPEKIAEASYYGTSDGMKGKKTASGETFNPSDFTAAHRTHPFGTILKVTNTKTGQSVNVRVNDRGPHIKGREVDLSKAAAEKIGIDRDKGVEKVKVEVVKKGETK